MPDLTEDYWALRKDAGAVWLPRDFIGVSGPDAITFLQGQLSQDVEQRAVGASAPSFLLQPQGKVDALLRVTRIDDHVAVLDTDAGFGEVARARLERFRLRIKADLEPLTWRCLAVRGPHAHEIATGLAADWPGLSGVDVVGGAPAVPDAARLCDLEAYEAVRIEAGVTVMGREIDERTIPAETGIVDRAVSFTKGCYTGQELVARIDSRGSNVPRRLRGVVVGTNVVPPRGAVVSVAGKDVGALTSVAESLERRAPVALAYIGRAVEPPAEATLTWEAGSAPARIEALPLVA
ncbi:MAG: folate-binding protein YgfZ [Acidimicrobiia bacterium]|nr:folate-binding protein YgfZ [Acidimicrobiia bacterium]